MGHRSRYFAEHSPLYRPYFALHFVQRLQPHLLLLPAQLRPPVLVKPAHACSLPHYKGYRLFSDSLSTQSHGQDITGPYTGPFTTPGPAVSNAFVSPTPILAHLGSFSPLLLCRPLHPSFLSSLRGGGEVPPWPGHVCLAFCSEQGVLPPPDHVHLPRPASLAQSKLVLNVTLHPGLLWVSGQLHGGGWQAHEVLEKDVWF